MRWATAGKGGASAAEQLLQPSCDAIGSTVAHSTTAAERQDSSQHGGLPSDWNALARVVVKERADNAKQSAKALAILEIKDGVITGLERELDIAQVELGAARADRNRLAAAESLAGPSREEQQQEKAEEERQPRFPSRVGPVRPATPEGARSRHRAVSTSRLLGRDVEAQLQHQRHGELELQRRSLRQAEADAATARREAQTLEGALTRTRRRLETTESQVPELQEASSSAMEKLQALSSELKQEKERSTEVKALSSELRSARDCSIEVKELSAELQWERERSTEAQRSLERLSITPAQDPQQEETLVRLQRSLLQCQRSLAHSEREAEAAQGAELAWRMASTEAFDRDVDSGAFSLQRGMKQVCQGIQTEDAPEAAESSRSRCHIGDSPSSSSTQPKGSASVMGSAPDDALDWDLDPSTQQLPVSVLYVASQDFSVQSLRIEARGLREELLEAKSEGRWAREELELSRGQAVSHQDRIHSNLEMVVSRLEAAAWQTRATAVAAAVRQDVFGAEQAVEAVPMALQASGLQEEFREAQTVARRVSEELAASRAEMAKFQERMQTDLELAVNRLEDAVAHPPHVSAFGEFGADRASLSPLHQEHQVVLSELHRLGQMCEQMRRELWHAAVVPHCKVRDQAASAAVASVYSCTATSLSQEVLVDGAPAASASSAPIELVRNRACSRDEASQTCAHHESHVEEAARAQAAILQRVESVLCVQRELHFGYHAAAEQLVELRTDRASQVCRAEELQRALAAHASELAFTTTRSTECAAAAAEATCFALETLQGQVVDLRAEKSQEVAHFRAEEAREAQLARQVARAESELEFQAAALAEELAEQSLWHRQQEVSVEVKLQDSHKLVEEMQERLHSQERRFEITLQEQEDGIVVVTESRTGQVLAELKDRRDELALLSHTEEDAEQEVALARAALARVGSELIEARSERASAQLAGSEACTQRGLINELTELVGERQKLQVRVEATEAREFKASVRCQEECDIWRHERQEYDEKLQAQSRSAAQEHQSEVSVAAMVQQCGRLLEEKEHLDGEVSNYSAALRDARTQADVLHSEHRMCEDMARKSVIALQSQLAAACGREAAMLHELERLRGALLHQSSGCGGPADAVADGELDRRRDLRAPCHRQSVASSAEDAHILELQQQHRSTSSQQHLQQHQQEHGDHWRARHATLAKEGAQLKEHMEDLETQLRLTKQESERRRALIAALQKRCGPAAAEEKEKAETVSEYEEARKRLYTAQRGLARKDAMIQDLRRDLSEVRQQSKQAVQREEAGASKAAADAARARSLRLETQRKEESLLQARKEAETLKSQLLAEMERKTPARARSAIVPGRRMQRVRDVPAQVALECAFETGGGNASSSKVPSLAATAAASIAAAPLQLDAAPPLALVDRSLRDSDEALLPGGCAGETDVSLTSLTASFETSALHDSLSILNLRPEDLSAFLSYA